MRKFFSMFLITIMFVFCISMQVCQAEDEGKEIDEIFDSFITDDSPGGAVIVIEEGKVIYKAAYGLADIKKKTPLNTKNIFHLGSTGKQFTALAVMMLAEKGKLKYDDPVGKYLPQLNRFGNKLTVRRMLHHTSGIPDYTTDDKLCEDLFKISGKPANKDALALLAKEGKLLFTPGERFEYSNTGYDMLGSLVEKLSGQTFPVFMEKHVFGPLGMKNTFSLPHPSRKKDSKIARSYEMEDGKIEIYDSDPMDDLVGSGSIYSTVEDMYFYDQALYTDKLVKQSTFAEALKPAKLNNGSNTDYGFGWEVGKTESGEKYMKHDGAWLGFISYYVRFPKERLSVIILLNRNYDLPEGDPEMEIADIFLK